LPELNAKRPRYLIFSLDTEPDDANWLGPRQGGLSHENLRALPGLAERLRALGVKTTFLCSYSVGMHDSLTVSLDPLLRAGLAEIGAHFHPGDTPPFGPWDSEAGDNIIRLPDGALVDKFTRLHEALASRFGPMASYRSAAWAIDDRVVGQLNRHGYKVDSSVTPGVSWAWNRRPSYLSAPAGAYYLDPDEPARPGNSDLLEVPVSIYSPRRWDGSVAERMAGHLFTMPMAARVGLLARGVRAIRPPPPMWLRPAFKDLDALKQVAELLAGEEYLHVMCHSNELWPGASPYVKTQAEVDTVIGRLEGFLRHCLDQGYLPVTLKEYAETRASRRRAEPPVAAEIGAGNGPAGDLAAPRKRTNPWILAAKGSVSLAILAVTLRFIDFGRMGSLLAKASPWMALACLGAILIDILLSAVKVSLMTEPPRVPVAKVYRFNLIKILFNNVLPGGVGGEAARVMCISREIGSVSESFAVVVWDRLSGLWGQILFTVLSLPMVAPGAAAPAMRWWLVGAGLAASAILSLALAPPPGLAAWGLRRFPARAGNYYRTKVERFSTRWLSLAGRRGRLARLVGIIVLSQVSMVFILCLAAAALGGHISLWQASPVLMAGALSSLLPFTLGGLGVTEAAYALGFSIMGSEHELGFLAALLIRTLCLLPALLGWVVMLREQILPFRASEPAAG
jgi:uncharacterized membrane protein YbhN (UPF0104 family)